MAKPSSVTVIAHTRKKPVRNKRVEDHNADNAFAAQESQFVVERPGHASSIDGVNHLAGAISLLNRKRV